MRLLLAVALVACAAAAGADPYIDSQTSAGASAQVTCAGVSSIVVPGSGSRIAWTLLNQSAVDAFICYGQVCTTGTGTRLQQNMGLIEQTYIGNVSCITGGGTATLGRLLR